MLIKQGLDFVQLVRNVVKKKKLSHTASGLFNPLKTTSLTVYQLSSKYSTLASARKRKGAIVLQLVYL